MRSIIRAVTPANQIPLLVSVDDAKVFMRVDTNAQDDLISGQIWTAMDLVERHCSQVLTPRTLEMVTDAFPVLPELVTFPRDPVTEIVSVKFTDRLTGDEIEMDSAAWRWADTSPDQMLPAFRQPWPVAASERGSVRIRFNAGYEVGLCPPPLVEAVKKTLLSLYDDRSGGGLSDAVKRDLRSFRQKLI